MYLFNPFEEVERFRTFSEAPGVLGPEARWRTPGFNLADGAIMSTLLTDDQLALVTPAHAGVLLLEETSQIGGLTTSPFFLSMLHKRMHLHQRRHWRFHPLKKTMQAWFLRTVV